MSFLRFFILLLGLVFFAAPASALSVDQLRFGVHDGKTRLVLDLSESSDFRVFVLGDPYRLVIDLPDFDWRAGPLSGPPDTGVKGVRHGNLQPGVSRIVLDINRPIGVHSAFMLPRQGEKPDRLVIDFGAVRPENFRQEMTKIHGTLTANAPVNSYAYENDARTASSATAPPIPQKKAKKPLIVIDPGHGGIDPGAIGANKIHEKQVTLALARELKSLLESSGQYRVMLTRDSDVFIKLGDRVKFAHKHEADLFISIHADSIEKPGVRGASVYTLSEKASDAQTERLAARENQADLIAGIDLSVEDEEVANILVDLAMRDTMNQSKFFANKLVDMYKARQLNLLDTPHRYAGFAVLKAPDIPSVLVEAGFMSNKQEAEMLNTPAYRKKVTEVLKNGIDAYFEQVRKNNRI